MQIGVNPYRPGAGLQPPELVGRQREIDLVELMVAHSRMRRNDGGLVLYGLRGVGKTVLLAHLRRIVEAADWVTVTIEARPGEAGRRLARQSLARGIAMAARRLRRYRAALDDVRAALPTLAAFSATLGGAGLTLDLEPSDHRANSGLLEVDLEELVEDLAGALRKNGTALAIFVDEMQDLDDDLMAALLSVQHRASQEEWPFYLVGAGLSTISKTLAEARSYAERFTIREIGPLDDQAAADALVLPAEALGGRFSPEAVDLLLAAANGYPFFIQTYGKAVWDFAPDREFDADVARAGIAQGNADLDQGFFPARWDRTTRLERGYLRAIAEIGGQTASTAAVADRLGYAPASLSPTRQSLIAKGMIFAERRGFVSFTVPNMASFIRRQTDRGEAD